MDHLQTRLNAEYDAWFKQLQALTKDELDPDEWVDLWYEDYTPAEALEVGPEDEE
jgi:hypothetical protein